MLYVCDTVFELGTSDFLSVDASDTGAPLNSDNIEETIDNMVMNITGAMGYTKCTPFGIDNYTMLDALYEEDKSVVIPVFIENFKDKTDDELKSLTPANVSFVVLTSVSGTIQKPEGEDNYCSTDVNGVLKENDIGKKLYGFRLVNFRYYRYARDDKFDCYPICSDIATVCYYVYKEGIDECAIMLDKTAFCLGSQVVVGTEQKFFPIKYFPNSSIFTFYTSDPHPLGEDYINAENFSEQLTEFLNDVDADAETNFNIEFGGSYFRNFSKFYVLSNKEI